MKKLLTCLLTSLLLLPNVSFSATKLATLSDGVHKAIVEVGSQSAQFYFGRGYTLYKEAILGSFAPSTGFTTKLLSSITSTVTTIYVSSVKDINGIALPCSATNKCYFNIEPGTSRQEPIVCTTAGTNYFSGCTRGLAASGSSEAAVTAYQLPHNAGSTIIMTNIAQFYGNFVDVTTTQNIGGLKTFTATTTFSGLPNTTSTYTPTADGDLTTKKFVTDSISAGGTDASEGAKGVAQLSTKAQAAAGTSSGSAARLVLPASMATSTSQVATTSIPVTNTSGKLDTSFIDQTANYSWSGTNTFSATSTFNGAMLNNRIIDAYTASTTITGATTPQPVYISTSTGAIWLSSSADNASTTVFDGFAISSATNGNTVYVQTGGIVSGFTGLTKGAEYFVNDTLGSIGTSQGTNPLKVGKAVSTTQILIIKEKTGGSLRGASCGTSDYYAYTDVNVTGITTTGGSNSSQITGVIDGTVVTGSSYLGAGAGMSMFVTKYHKWHVTCSGGGWGTTVNFIPFN